MKVKLIFISIVILATSDLFAVKNAFQSPAILFEKSTINEVFVEACNYYKNKYVTRCKRTTRTTIREEQDVFAMIYVACIKLKKEVSASNCIKHASEDFSDLYSEYSSKDLTDAEKSNSKLIEKALLDVADANNFSRQKRRLLKYKDMFSKHPNK